MERNVFRKADGSSKLLSAIIRNTYEGKTDHLPEDWHRKLVIALAHDDVTIEDTRYLKDVVIDGDYGIAWDDFLNNPLAQATFTIQTTPFSATNNNCQSCAEITQLELVDDYTDVVWEEGTTVEYPDVITQNDYICCFPYEIEIVSFNTTYFDSVTVDQDGILTVEIKALTPILDDVFVAKYRVTCENGGYDEADIYGNVNGSDTSCFPPSNLEVELTPSAPTALLSWTRNPLPAGGYNYWLYDCADIYTPVFQGNIPTNNSIQFTVPDPQGCYIFVIQADCGGGSVSTNVTLEFTMLARPGGDRCGNFSVTYIPDASLGIQSFSYMDCSGVVQNHTFVAAGTVELCMLINEGEEVPVFFAASTPDIEYLYIELC